jgi:hypothetical protein
MNLLNFQILKSVGFALRTLKMGNLEVKEKAKENLPKNTPNPFIKKTGCRLLGVMWLNLVKQRMLLRTIFFTHPGQTT